MNKAIDNLQLMIAYRESEMRRLKEDLDRLLDQGFKIMVQRAEIQKDIESFKDAIDTLEKRNA